MASWVYRQNDPTTGWAAGSGWVRARLGGRGDPSHSPSHGQTTRASPAVHVALQVPFDTSSVPFSPEELLLESTQCYAEQKALPPMLAHKRVKGQNRGLANTNSNHLKRDYPLETATSRATSCRDIVALVLDEALECNRTLAAMARVCKAYNPIAITRLWRNLRDLEPLLRLFPTLKVERDSFYSYSKKLTLSTDPSEEDWTRFDFFAQSVRQVDRVSFSTSICWEFFSPRYDRDRPILPRLVRLGRLNVWLPFPIISALLPVTLQDITFDLPLPGDHPMVRHPLRNALAALALTAKNVTRIRIDGVDEESELAPLQALKSFHTLVVTLNELTFASMIHLGGTHLRCLDIRFQTFNADLDYQSFHGRFCALEDLHISFSCDGSRAIGKFLEVARPPSLRHLKLSIQDPWRFRVSSSHAFGSLAPVADSIESFVLESPDDYDDDVPLLDIHIIEPVLALHRLTTLKISIFPMVLFNDVSLAASVSAWPLLRVLCIEQDTYDPDKDCYHGSQPPVRPTIHALKIVAERCPLLEEFTFESDFQLDTLPSSFADIPRPLGHRLHYLKVDCKKGLNADANMPLAFFVDSLFPHLRLPPPFPTEKSTTEETSDVFDDD
ncbi:uncharacterized protein BXZ73DRAFT_86029, partial [Epithele typhae]|uniref:uncharacterized protein n=1 Tax=Epithele typhae TaxID=378194 RepID=UPI0020076F88